MGRWIEGSAKEVPIKVIPADRRIRGVGAAADIGLAATDSPVFGDVKLSALTDGYIPYHVDDATGLADGPTKANVDDAVTKKHAIGGDTTLGAMAADINANSHQVVALSVPDASGKAIRATAKITEALLESATDLKHAAVTVSAPIVLTTQALELKNNAGPPAQVTAIDTGALADSDTVIPTSKAVTAALAVVSALNYPFWQILTGETVTVPMRQQYAVFGRLDLRGTISLAAGAELVVFL